MFPTKPPTVSDSPAAEIASSKSTRSPPNVHPPKSSSPDTPKSGEAAKKQIAGLALFGDPSNGASVKGVPQEKIKTWCEAKDGVCARGLNIGIAHLAYTVMEVSRGGEMDE